METTKAINILNTIQRIIEETIYKEITHFEFGKNVFNIMELTIKLDSMLSDEEAINLQEELESVIDEEISIKKDLFDRVTLITV